MKAQALNRSRLTDHTAARRDPALEKVGAELDALSSGGLGGADAGDGIHAYLTDHASLSDPSLHIARILSVAATFDAPLTRQSSR